jgi:hypothetical protein
VVFDHPTAAALAAFLLARLDGARATGAATPVEADTAGDEGLAAIDEMDVDDLIRMTYETTRSAVEG